MTEDIKYDRMLAIRVISTRANILKKDATLEEIRMLLAYMES